MSEECGRQGKQGIDGCVWLEELKMIFPLTFVNRQVTCYMYVALWGAMFDVPGYVYVMLA